MTADPSTIAGGLQAQGLYYLCALLVVAVVAEFFLLWRVFSARLADRDAAAAQLAIANAARADDLKQVLPVADHLAIAVGRLDGLKRKSSNAVGGT